MLDQHLHITGSARSGTTQMLGFMRTCYRWDYAPGRETRFDEAVRHRRGNALTRSVDTSDIGAVVASRNTWLIFCVRDPRDVVCSRHGSERSRYWTSTKFYRQNRTALIPHEQRMNVQIVRYEDLIDDPDGVQAHIEARLGWLPPGRPFSGEQGILRAPAPNRSGPGIGRWRQHLPRIAGEIERFGPINDLLVRDGYERDRGWTRALDGVVPDTSYSGMELNRLRKDRTPPRKPILKRALRRLGLR
jgi:hypothetical protein